MNAQTVVEERRELVEWLHTRFGLGWAQKIFERLVSKIPTNLDTKSLAKWFADACQIVPLYFVTEQMQTVINAAVLKFSPVKISIEDLPKTGLLRFAKPLVTPNGKNINAVLWLARPKDISIFTFHEHEAKSILEYIKPDEAEYQVTQRQIQDARFPTLTPCPSFAKVPTEMKIDWLKEDTIFIRHVMATLLLMQQRVGEEVDERVNRPTARRCQRARVPSDVRVLYLRRPASSSGQANSTVDWSHQWIVGGHWRQQPYKDGVRPKWIAPYVKGPEDKPLVVRDTVHVLAK